VKVWRVVMGASALVGAFSLASSPAAQAGQAPLVSPWEWRAYAGSFLAASGRIVDTGNGGISHSEGQGYGLLLAYLAGMRSDFERIWRFTYTEMMIRDDGLVAWKWDPGANPHITDVNNASDGDILIAYALARAGADWNQPAYSEAAAALAAALGETVLKPGPGGHVLLPGARGFSAEERADGPVVNLSYWVFEAFPLLSQLDPAHDWQRVSRVGEMLVRDTRIGKRQLPPEWLSLAGIAEPAAGFPAEFGYNALRIPLYLIRAGMADPPMLARLLDGMSLDGNIALSDLEANRVTLVLEEPGYRAIPALVRCSLSGAALPPEVKSFSTTHYYPSTLHLLVLSHARKELPQCL
jgi:endoglucanase